MPNTVANSTWIVNETGDRFTNSIHLVPNLDRSYDDQYRQAGAKVGYTVFARLPHRTQVRRGQGFSAQAIYDETAPITLSYQSGADFDWSTASEAMELDRIRERYINPSADAIASDIDAQCGADLYSSVYNMVGTLGTTPATNLVFLQAKQKILDLSGGDDDYYAVLDTAAEVALVNANLSSFNPRENVERFFKRGLMGEGNLGIKEWYRDQNVPRHTSGTFTASTPLVNGASQTGSTININGWASGATSLKKGDIFTIAGVYSVNGLSKVSTGRLQQFVITADTSDAVGVTATLPISPSIITSGPRQTVSASPANGAAVTVWSANPAGGTLATTVSPQSFVFRSGFAAFVMADLAQPAAGADVAFARSKDWGFSIRYLRTYDSMSDTNIARLDTLWGNGILQPRLCTRVVG